MQFSKTSIFHSGNTSSAKHHNLRAISERDYFQGIEVQKPAILFIRFSTVSIHHK